MFALCNHNTAGLLQREYPLNLGPKWAAPTTPIDLSVGDIRSQIAAEWLQIAQWSQWRAYRKLPSLFLMVPSLTPYDLPSPKWGFYMPQHTRMAISLQRPGDPIHFMFGSLVGFSGTADRTALFTIRTNPRWRQPHRHLGKISNGHISATAHSAHRAVIFAIAQLSCFTLVRIFNLFSLIDIPETMLNQTCKHKCK